MDRSTLSEMQRLVLMAAAAHGYGPQSGAQFNCAQVVATALTWGGQMTPEVRITLCFDSEYHPVVRECYGQLIALVQRRVPGEALLDGRGNFGTPDEPLALPMYTACWLTPAGERVARVLLAERPECRVADDLHPGASDGTDEDSVEPTVGRDGDGRLWVQF